MSAEQIVLPETGQALESAKESYTEGDVEVKRDAAHIRQRPGMYIGDTGTKGLHHLVYELVGNSVDEALAGFCKSIHVRIKTDGSLSVSDDGRGIPVEEHAIEKRPTLEVVMTTVGAGAKFSKGSYRFSGGLHGMGAKAVTALSEWTEARVYRDGRGSFDAIRDLAEAYPLTVFRDAVGMPRENRRFLLPYGNMVFNSFGPRNEFFEAAVADAAPVLEWVQAQSRRDALAPTGFGAVIHAAVDSGEVTADEAPILVRSLLTAGVDTTVDGIGAAVYCLARCPGEFQRLRADPALARPAFEEAVRLESPVQTFFRTTTKPVQIGDEIVGEGRKILMFLGAANRDPRWWERPDKYDITRRNAGHVGFGAGIHGCVGAVLARLEGELVLSTLARKVASIEITGEPKRRYNNTLRGMASLPVTIRAA